MNLLRLLFISIFAWLGWRSVRGIQQASNEQEKALAIRGNIVLWTLGVAFLVAMVLLPSRARLLFLIPLILVLGSAFKAYRNSRRHIRETAAMDAKLERMKRVN